MCDSKNKYIFAFILCGIARLSAALLVIVSFAGLFINPIVVIYKLVNSNSVDLWKAVLLEIVLFCSFATYPSLDVVAKQIDDQSHNEHDSVWKKVLNFTKTTIVIAFYLWIIICLM